MKSPKTTKLSSPKETPVIDLPSQPDESEKILRLLSRYRAYREDDKPEESANRLSSMALMLSNIAAAHRAVRADGVEADLGVGFAVEGGYISYDIKQSVMEPSFRLQKDWERNLLHDVDSDTPGHDRNNKPFLKNSRDYYDDLFLPASQIRRHYTLIQKQAVSQKIDESIKRTSSVSNNPRAAQSNGIGAGRAHQQSASQQRNESPNQSANMQGTIPNLNVANNILHDRQDTFFREATGYRVFLADATSAAGLEQRVMQAHLGRFVIHSSIDSYDAFERMGKTLKEFVNHRNIRRGDATLTLLADPVLCVGPGVLNEAVTRGTYRIHGFNRLVWLVESAAGYDLPDRVVVEEEIHESVLNFQDACHNEISQRINFTNRQEHDLPALTGHLASWRKFLREQESHHPSIAGSVWNLPFALCYGLEAMCNHRAKAVGEEVMALAKWLVVRMTNRLTAVSSAGQRSQIELLATKLANKLVTHGPMTVRNLTRKFSQLTANDCRQALCWLEDRQIAAQKDNSWGIRADSPAVQSFMAANAN